MPAKILNGRALVPEIRREVTDALNQMVSLEFAPHLAVIRTEECGDAQVWTEQKEKSCKDLGILLWTHVLPGSSRTRDAVKLIESLNADKKVHGILIQHPLPERIDGNALLDALDPAKDVEGVHALNVGRLCRGVPTVESCAASAIIRLLDYYGVRIAGRRAVVVGRGDIVGKPTAMMLMNRDATVTICHGKTENLAETVRAGDIIVAAAGLPRLITADMVKPGAVVVDAGINVSAGGTVGDVDYGPVAEKASWIAPVPGGVGPVSVAMLMKNITKVTGNFA